MATDPGDRTRHFAAIERKHGLPASHWLGLLAELGEAKYPEQMALLQEGHGFSRGHANALVMYHRGSPTSRRYASHDEWFAAQTPEAADTARAIFAAIGSRIDGLEPVIAWNHPMLRNADGYVVGCSAASKHISINPFSATVMDGFRDRLGAIAGGNVTAHLFSVPFGWTVDADLLADLVSARLTELETGTIPHP
jgi:uncharacterized protein YdhG (YjbR/CyaY superfamily)